MFARLKFCSDFLSVHIQLRIECQTISRLTPSELPSFQGKTVPPSTSVSLKGEASGSFSTAEDVLKLAAVKLQQTTGRFQWANSTSGFAYYLEKVRKVVIVDITQKQKILFMTVECSSLQILEDLWNDYRCEYLSGWAEDTLVTQGILEELGLTSAKLRTTISEKEYKDCRVQFLKNLGEYDHLLIFTPGKTNIILINFFSYFPVFKSKL